MSDEKYIYLSTWICCLTNDEDVIYRGEAARLDLNNDIIFLFSLCILNINNLLIAHFHQGFKENDYHGNSPFSMRLKFLLNLSLKLPMTRYLIWIMLSPNYTHSYVLKWDWERFFVVGKGDGWVGGHFNKVHLIVELSFLYPRASATKPTNNKNVNFSNQSSQS